MLIQEGKEPALKDTYYRITIQIGKRIYSFRYLEKDEERAIMDAVRLVEDKGNNFNFRALCLFLRAAKAVKKLKTFKETIVLRGTITDHSPV